MVVLVSIMNCKNKELSVVTKVEALMRQMGLKAREKRKYKITTDSLAH